MHTTHAAKQHTIQNFTLHPLIALSCIHNMLKTTTVKFLSYCKLGKRSYVKHRNTSFVKTKESEPRFIVVYSVPLHLTSRPIRKYTYMLPGPSIFEWQWIDSLSAEPKIWVYIISWHWHSNNFEFLLTSVGVEIFQNESGMVENVEAVVEIALLSITFHQVISTQCNVGVIKEWQKSWRYMLQFWWHLISFLSYSILLLYSMPSWIR